MSAIGVGGGKELVAVHIHTKGIHRMDELSTTMKQFVLDNSANNESKDESSRSISMGIAPLLFFYIN